MWKEVFHLNSDNHYRWIGTFYHNRSDNRASTTDISSNIPLLEIRTDKLSQFQLPTGNFFSFFNQELTN
jgi:hypothetical protein